MKESENINNLREIKREFRKNNLDNSLLFLCSILSIIFGFLEVYIGDSHEEKHELARPG